MSKGVKKVLGVVAAIAIPFVAPGIAATLGVSTTLGTAAVGAGLGAATSALTGGDPLLGAMTGGLGTFAAGGGFQNMFGGSQPLVAGQQAVGGGLAGPGMTTGTPLYQQAGYAAGGAQSLLPPAAGAGAAASGAASAASGAASAASGGLSEFFSQVTQGLLNNPAGVTQLAMTVFGRPPQQLTEAEQAQLEELEQMAVDDRELFEQRVRAANEMIQMAAQNAPNPQQAFAETKIATERQLAEQTRGLEAGEAALAQRRAAIRGTQTGATAAAAEEERGRRTQAGLLQQGYNMLPTSAPQGAAGMSMPIWQSLQDRRDQYYRDLARASGDLFGGIS